VFAVRRTDNENIRITIRFRVEVPRTSPTWYQISNIIFKRFVVACCFCGFFCESLTSKLWWRCALWLTDGLLLSYLQYSATSFTYHMLPSISVSSVYIFSVERKRSSVRVRTILVLGIEYRPMLTVSASIDIRPILSLYSHAILVSRDGRYNCCDVTSAAAFDCLQPDGRPSTYQ